MNDPRLRALSALLLLLAAVPLRAADPQVSNIRVAQRTDGSRLVDIHYDVTDADGDTLTVSVQASDDGGTSWLYPVRTLSGDVGPGVVPGTDRHIVWDLAADGVTLEATMLRVRVIASDLGVNHMPHSPYHIVQFMDTGTEDWLSPTLIERAARADLVIVQNYQVWGHPRYEEGPSFVAAIKAQNSRCKLIGYVSAKTARWEWQHIDSEFARRWYQETRPFWCWTTTGDTLSDWPGAAVINILDPACRKAMIDLIVEYQRTSNNPMDGVLWDYFNNGLWIPDFVDVTGEPDMDQDGIPQAEDPDEIAAYKEACVALVTALRDSLGDGFIQVFNGQRAYQDSAFAALSDGIQYELFPTLGFPDDRNLHAAIDPAYPTNLFRVVTWPRTTAGGPYVILENINRAQYVDTEGNPTILNFGDLFRVVSLLVDHTYTAWGHHNEAWPANDFSLGPPLGPPVIDGIHYSRDFRYGRLEMEITYGFLPKPFDYTIWCNGVMVERLAIPYHYP